MIRHDADTRPRSARDVVLRPHVSGAHVPMPSRALLVFFVFVFVVTCRSPPVLHTSNTHLQATTTSLWLHASCAPTHWHSSYLQPPTSTASLWLGVQRISRELLAFALMPPSRTEPLSSVLASRHLPLPYPPPPQIILARETPWLSFLYRTHWVGAGRVSLTSLGHGWANRRPLDGEVMSFLRFSYHGRPLQ
ncbi:hypothetical protein EDD17DRAFT_435289 [Pisolithus thermaeus]|nr:hypothetical protein EDD17DRAFT_435289 [Pisolithus thermaeus]